MARINGSGFKMKSSPAKGVLSNFFSSLGKQATAGQKDRGIFSEKGKAEKKSRKPGESKFQADVRRKKETNKAKKAENKADAAYYGSAEDKAKNSDANRIKKTPPPADDTGGAGELTFKQAFAAARKAGKKTFSFKGKPYTTELAKTKKKKTPSTPKVKKFNTKTFSKAQFENSKK